MLLFKKQFVCGIFCLIWLISLFPFNQAVALSAGDSFNFYIEPSYDYSKREQTTAILKHVSQRAYFYLDNNWHKGLTDQEKQNAVEYLQALGDEFDSNIYPRLSSLFGTEWRPGIDGDERITILFHQLKEGAAGYMRTRDEFPVLQAPGSNEREMIYLNIDFLAKDSIKGLLAHEYVHLIEYNQKERLLRTEEEVWLSEMRAYLGPIILNYNGISPGSSLQQYLRFFVETPTDSLTEWDGEPADYGVSGMFAYYLADHYGSKVLADTMFSKKVGIPSLEEVFLANGIHKSFSQVFTEFTVAVFLNDCSVGESYCFRNQNLRNLKISPSLILLPSAQKSEFYLDATTTYWAGNWYRIMGGGGGTVTITFQGGEGSLARVPYVFCQQTNGCAVNFLSLDISQKGSLIMPNFGTGGQSLTLIPSLQSKNLGFDGRERDFSFIIKAKVEPSLNPSTSTLATSTVGTSSSEISKAKLMAALIQQVELLNKQINALQAQLAILRGASSVFCLNLKSNLRYHQANEEVKCLQEFLKQQGIAIYPEGWVTGYFGKATQKAVIRFQEKYAAEILKPWGLSQGNGVVGTKTRAKINQLLGG